MTQQWKPIPAALYDLILTGDMEAILWQLKGVREAETVRMILYNARQTILSTSAPVDVQEDRKQVARKAIEWATPSNVMAAPLVACEHIRGMAALVLTPPASAQPERDWELSCDHCDGDGFVYVERRVGMCATDVQTFKEDCECCEGRGFTIAFEDIPGIAEYVRKSRLGASAQDDAKDELTRDRIERIATEVYTAERFTKDDEVWHNLYWLTSFAKAIEKELRRPAPAAGDALALLDHPLLRDVLGYIEDAGPADVWGAAQSWMALRDAALAAQIPQQGEA
ncbi:hypothetical protein [Achromobacter insolitus]|uniref:hypothetical protein n=1 Tax=Achromobacter insolitus TaxID=217204 RepID=UPI0020A44611|nr:hypothetical protein [Achromobacter insolitus]MCP1404295.1 hypothetical protein [Achromobacter insolitus]